MRDNMKKIDLHVHTIQSISDKPFTYSLNTLKEYVKEKQIDSIAITNHNLFDESQFKEISDELQEIKVFPGIEIDIESGHMLVITEETDLSDFVPKCEEISKLIVDQKSTIAEAKVIEIMGDLSKYLIIPHYDKKPVLDFAKIPNVKDYIFCGEAASVKKFLQLKKNSSELVPVYFSDIRIDEKLTEFPDRQTYVDVDEISISSLKIALRDSTKVSLDKHDGKVLFYIDDNNSEFKISSGLTVILGERSSGKTFTLNRINECFNNKTYIKQFELFSKNDGLEQREFDKTLRNRSDSTTQSFLQEFKTVVDDVLTIDLNSDNKSVDEFLDKLKKSALETERQDAYAKCAMFNEQSFESDSTKSLVELISSVDNIIENVEYSDVITQYVDINNLKRLSIELKNKYIDITTLNKEKEFANNIILNIKQELTMHSTNTAIPDIDFYNLVNNSTKVNKFIEIVNGLKRTRVIDKQVLSHFTNVGTVKCFRNASNIRDILSIKQSMADSFSLYSDPYQYLCALKNKEEITASEIYKYFVYIDYEVKNRHGTKASGGEQSEYNLLQKLKASSQNDILILDEPESSFDNLFLKNGVNTLLKELSSTIPVVISTHNNTIGASVHPDYIIYTKKDILQSGDLKYHLYCGKPSDEFLIDTFDENEKIPTGDILLNCLEAGKDAYNERRKTYEMFNN